MKEHNNYTTIYTGSEILVTRLQYLLKEAGILSIVKNALNSGRLAGFGGGTLNSVQLKIKENDFNRAQSILQEFSK